MKGHSTHWL